MITSRKKSNKIRITMSNHYLSLLGKTQKFQEKKLTILRKYYLDRIMFVSSYRIATSNTVNLVYTSIICWWNSLSKKLFDEEIKCQRNYLSTKLLVDDFICRRNCKSMILLVNEIVSRWFYWSTKLLVMILFVDEIISQRNY